MRACAPRARSGLVAAVFTVALVLGCGEVLAGGVPAAFLGPTPYLSVADSPFAADINAGHVYLETFECGNLTVPGVTFSTGTIIPPGFEGLVDSVDADDGSIDGSGLAGHSLFTGDGATGITFTFNQTTLGAFPTQVGIVWTDGGGTATFEAFDSIGASLGVIGPVAIGDASNSGETAEDRFFGVTFPGGISAIKISKYLRRARGRSPPVRPLRVRDDDPVRRRRSHADADDDRDGDAHGDGRPRDADGDPRRHHRARGPDALVPDAGASRTRARGRRARADPEDVTAGPVVSRGGNLRRRARAPSCPARPVRSPACRRRCGN